MNPKADLITGRLITLMLVFGIFLLSSALLVSYSSQFQTFGMIIFGISVFGLLIFGLMYGIALIYFKEGKKFYGRNINLTKVKAPYTGYISDKSEAKLHGFIWIGIIISLICFYIYTIIESL